MSPLAEFLERLFRQGRVVYRQRPSPQPRDRAEAVAELERAFEADRLDLAGPPVAFDPDAALAAAGLVWRAGWFLLRRDEPVEVLERELALADPGPGATVDAHVSADLTLRYLPQLHRRARALAPGDRLHERLAEVLRGWPMSGVLSDLEAGPASPPAFGGHAGALLRYVERWSRHQRPAWLPAAEAADLLELVLEGQGQARPAALWKERLAAPAAVGAAAGPDDEEEGDDAGD